MSRITWSLCLIICCFICSLSKNFIVWIRLLSAMVFVSLRNRMINIYKTYKRLLSSFFRMRLLKLSQIIKDREKVTHRVSSDRSLSFLWFPRHKKVFSLGSESSDPQTPPRNNDCNPNDGQHLPLLKRPQKAIHREGECEDSFHSERKEFKA